MADDVIKEYLLALGWKIDKASEQRFNNAVGTTTKTVAALGASLTAAATAIYATVIKIASGLDEIYFSAQRSNTSVSNVRAYAYALSQLGVAGNAAQATIEGIAKAIRTNPGNESLLRSLGVQTRDANGGLRDTIDIIVDLDKQLSKKPQYIASQYAAALGIDEGTFNAIRGQAEQIQKSRAEHQKLAGQMGVNPDKAAKDANALMTTVRQFQAQVDLLVLKIVQDLGPALMGYITDFSRWVTDHREEIVQFVNDVVKAFVEMVQGIKDAVEASKPLLEGFNAMSLSLTGKDGLQVALAAVLLYMTTKWVGGMLAAAASVSSAFGFLGPIIALISGGSLLADYANPAGGRSPVTGRFSGGLPYNTPGSTRPYNQPDNGPWSWGGIWGWAKRKLGFGGGGGGPVQRTSVTADMSIPERGRALLDTIAGTEAQGYNVMYGGGTFSDYSDHPRQAKPILSGPNAGRTSTAAGRYQFLASTWDSIAGILGLKDFSPESQDKAAWFLAQQVYKQRTNRDLATDLQSDDPRTIGYIGQVLSGTWTSLPGGIEQGQGHGAMAQRFNAALAAERGRTGKPSAPRPLFNVAGKFNGMGLKSPAFTSPSLSGAGTPLLPWGMPLPGATSVDIKQNSTFNIYGGGDPHITAAEVTRKQGTLNGALLSNVKGAVQ